jgi:integration host factor subunit alpha
MTLTKSDIVDNISQNTGLRKSQAIQVVETTLEVIKSALDSGESLLVSGFGKFVVKEKKARRGRNPQTGHELMLKPRRVVTFRSSRVLSDRINGKESS